MNYIHSYMAPTEAILAMGFVPLARRTGAKVSEDGRREMLSKCLSPQHEEEVLGGQNGFVAYEKRFWYPAEGSKSHSKLYYSYETGPLHIVMLGCYVDYAASSEQARWLRQDLASVDRSRTPWLLVGMHVSLWLQVKGRFKLP